MTKTLKSLPIAMAAAVSLAVSTFGVLAEEPQHDEHHPAGAATQDSQAAVPGAASKPDANKMGGMMGGDHMQKMTKMMQEMHGKMMGGGMQMMPKGDTGPSSMAFNGITMKMHQDMAMTYSGNADVDFVKGMIPHHEAAVGMAKTVLAFGKDPEVKKVAEGVIKAQESEINWMKDWLKKQGQ